MKRVILSTSPLGCLRGNPANAFGGLITSLKRTFPVTAVLILGLAAGPLLLSQSTGLAQTEEATETTETTESLGTISEFGPDSIVIHSERSSEAIPFSYTQTTTYVDETGAPVARETIRKGSPVTVYYVREGDRMVATRVVVRKAPPAGSVIERKTTTTTTTEDDDR
jgi:hypothetical protein